MSENDKIKQLENKVELLVGLFWKMIFAKKNFALWL